MNKFLFHFLGLITAVGCVVWAFSTIHEGSPGAGDPKNATYLIEGERVKLENGLSTVSVTPLGSPSRVITRYFGNELKTDLDGDGKEDVAFILTQERGGSGV